MEALAAFEVQTGSMIHRCSPMVALRVLSVLVPPPGGHVMSQPVGAAARMMVRHSFCAALRAAGRGLSPVHCPAPRTAVAGASRQAARLTVMVRFLGSASVTLTLAQVARHPLGREARTAAWHCAGTDVRGLGFAAAAAAGAVAVGVVRVIAAATAARVRVIVMIGGSSSLRVSCKSTVLSTRYGHSSVPRQSSCTKVGC